MSERNDEKKEQAWADRLPEEEDRDDTPEKTYRDGSAIHECWNVERENA